MQHFYRREVNNVVSLIGSSVELADPSMTEITQDEYLQASARPELTSAELFDQSRGMAKQSTVVISNTIRERVAKATHYLQTTRWPVQLAAAQDVLANGEAASALNKSMLDTEARLRERGETREQLAGKVLANSQAFTLVGACVDGIETATLDKIAAYAGADPEAFGAIVAQAKLDAHVELVAIFTPTLGEAQAEALVAQIVGA